MLVSSTPWLRAGARRWLRAQDIAQANHLPCIYLIDGGGAKLDSQGSVQNDKKKKRSAEAMSFEGALPAQFVMGGVQFYNQARMSSLGIPQVTVVCGMCTAGGAYTPVPRVQRPKWKWRGAHRW